MQYFNAKVIYRVVQRKKTLIDFCLVVVMIIFTALVTNLYISSEHYVYYFDTSNYWNQTSELVSSLRESPIKAIWEFYVSLSTDYSKLPCLLLVPFISILGNSRWIYIFSSAVVYLVPFSLVVGAIAAKLIPTYPRIVFWSTAFLSLLMPATWIAVLRGYPDIGGAFLIGLAVLIYLQDLRLNTRWKAILIGVLLALAILFRRHFAYSVRAFLGALILQTFIILIIDGHNRTSKKNIRDIKRYAVLIVLIVISSLVTLTVLGPKFVYRLLTVNYRELYASWERPISDTFQYYLNFYGWLTWLTTAVGFSAGILTRTLVRPSIFFVVTFGILSLVQWGLASKQLGVHYTTHFTMFVVLGIQAFLWMLMVVLQDKRRTCVLATGILLLAFNFVNGLTAYSIFASLQPFLAQSNPPLVRNDYSKFVQMVKYLRGITAEKDYFFVIDAGVINDALLTEADVQFFGQKHKKLKVLPIPHVDSRDFYPLEGLIQAQYVIVAEPIQYELNPQEQNVITVALDVFTKNWEFSQDFQRLKKQFFLDKGVTISIYRRTKPASLVTIFRTLKEMQKRIQPKPGGQSDWIVLETLEKGGLIGKNPDNTIEIRMSKPPTMRLLYFGTVPKTANLTGQVELLGHQCPTLSLQLSTLNSQGDRLDSVRMSHSINSSNNISLSLKGNQAGYLDLDISHDDQLSRTSNCKVKFHNLDVS